MNQRLAWGNKVSDDFRARVFTLVRDFQWLDHQASDLMACMAFETGETFSPSIKNAAGSGATGLIQFMPSTARGMGFDIDEIAAMSAETQLLVVKRYFLPYYFRIKTLSDMYMAILMPKYIGRSEDSVLFTKGTVAYRQNQGLDLNHSGKITKREAASLVQKKLDKGLLPGNCFEG